MNDTLNFDTIDILAAALGAFIAFSFLTIPADRGTERIVVGLCVFFMVAIKRFFIPTQRPNPNSSRLLRMTYLLIALIGTSFLALITCALIFDIKVFLEPMVKNGMFIFGGLLLAIATFIDQHFLKAAK